MKRIKGYSNISKERTLRVRSESELVKTKKNLDNVKIKKIEEDFNKMRDRFLKPKIKKLENIFIK